MTVANVSIVAGLMILGFQQPWQGHRGPSEAEKEASRVRIGITKAQQAQIEAIFENSGKQEQEVRKKMRALYSEMYAKVYHKYDFDRHREEMIQKEIFDLYKQRMRIQSSTQAQLRKVINRDQFDRMIAEMDKKREEMKRMWEQRGRRPGGPGGAPHRFPSPGRVGKV